MTPQRQQRQMHILGQKRAAVRVYDVEMMGCSGTGGKRKGCLTAKHAQFLCKTERRDETDKMSFLTCSRPDPSSKMGSSAAAVSSSVCIFLLATPSYLRTGSRRLPPRRRPKAGTSPAERARSPHPPQVGIRFHDGGACGK